MPGSHRNMCFWFTFFSHLMNTWFGFFLLRFELGVERLLICEKELESFKLSPSRSDPLRSYPETWRNNSEQRTTRRKQLNSPFIVRKRSGEFDITSRRLSPSLVREPVGVSSLSVPINTSSGLMSMFCFIGCGALYGQHFLNNSPDKTQSGSAKRSSNCRLII